MVAWIKRFFGKKPAENMWIADVAIAGLQHYRGNDLAELIKVGDGLSLEPQSDNDYDGSSIMVLWNHNKIGYIPTALSSNIRRQIESGVNINASIIEIKPVRFGRQWIKIRLHSIA